MDKDKTLVVFQNKKIRRIWNENQWFFSVVDVVGVLTDSTDPKDYWYRLKKRESESSNIELSTFCRQLRLISSDGKFYETDCADTKAIFRIIQSIPSKKTRVELESRTKRPIVSKENYLDAPEKEKRKRLPES